MNLSGIQPIGTYENYVLYRVDYRTGRVMVLNRNTNKIHYLKLYFSSGDDGKAYFKCAGRRLYVEWFA